MSGLIARSGGLAPVLFVSAGLLQPKKRDHPLARRQLYLNYGALGLASLCSLNGIETALVHGEHENPEQRTCSVLVGSGRPLHTAVSITVWSRTSSAISPALKPRAVVAAVAHFVKSGQCL